MTDRERAKEERHGGETDGGTRGLNPEPLDPLGGGSQEQTGHGKETILW